ncbi:MAG: NAD(P)-binding domain-containing protein [Gammaproteobacteria bacterium]|nr:NAD(P)-binding domain-containing protein [Gammaproteobacteria bacterium]
MGRPMALNLLAAGHPVAVYARRPEAALPLAERGAVVCQTPHAVAERADVVFTVVSDTPDVEAVLLGPDGVIHGARAGTVVVDMSTVAPSATRRIAAALAERGVDMLDAPVSGGESGAVAGTLSIMVGGRAEVYAQVLPLLQLLGRNIVHVGDHGAGQVAKLCNQVVVAETIAGVAEALLLARRAGVDPAKVREALMGGFAGSRILEVHGQRMLDGNYAPGFKASLHDKDMRLVREAAAELGIDLPGAGLVGRWIAQLVEDGKGDLDSSAVAQVLEDEAALTRTTLSCRQGRREGEVDADQ